MNRTEKILFHIDKNGRGLEIGPSYNPVAPRKSGYKVHVIDHLDRDALVAKYKKLGVGADLLRNIEEVDFIWQDQSYDDLTGKRKYYDWVIASHVIEHTTDLIEFLNRCDRVLKDDGVLSLVVPDKRYCFDHYRPVTSLSKIIDSHLKPSRFHTPGTAAEFYLNVVSRGDKILWSAKTEGQYALAHSLDDARRGMKSAAVAKAYEDFHAWCFSPQAFRLLIQDLFDLGLIPLRELQYFPTAGFEFFIALSRTGNGLAGSRLEMLDAIESEAMVNHERWAR